MGRKEGSRDAKERGGDRGRGRGDEIARQKRKEAPERKGERDEGMQGVEVELNPGWREIK